MGAVLFCCWKLRLEVEVQGHLDLARRADGVLHDTETGRAVIKTAGQRVRCATPCGLRSRSGGDRNGNVVEALVLIHIILRNVEAGGVGEVIGFEGVAKDVMLVDGQFLNQRRVGALLPGLAEDITFTGDKAGFKVVSLRNAAGTGREDWNVETRGFQSRALTGRGL